MGGILLRDETKKLVYIFGEYPRVMKNVKEYAPVLDVLDANDIYLW